MVEDRAPECIPDSKQSVSDFFRIMYGEHRLTADDFNHEHERCLAFVKLQKIIGK